MLVIQPCLICGDLVFTDKVGTCLCGTHAGLVARVYQKGTKRLVLHRIRLQSQRDTKFVDLVNKILQDDADYIIVRGKVIDGCEEVKTG